MTFEFFNVPRILFGRGQLARLPDLVPSSARAFLVYNGSDILAERVEAAMKRPAAARFRQRGEPTVDDIDRALAAAREHRCDFVLGAGGGSAIDAAKAVAGLLSNGGGATDYMEIVGKGHKIARPAVPWIAIPTTAGTGAEVTRNAVIGWPAKKFKASLRSEMLMASAALIDPDLHVDVPPNVTASSGMDALCQCIEAYVSTGANALTDPIAVRGVELAGRYLKRAYDDGSDLEARQGMALAALFSGIALTNAGLGAVHGFAAPLGANFPVPHGTACGLLLPLVIEANVSAARQVPEGGALLQKYETVGRALGEREGSGFQTCADLARHLNLPKLSQFGVAEADIEPMVQLAKRASSMRYNPVRLDDGALSKLLRGAL